MSREIKISAGDLEVTGRLNETNTAGKIWEALPLTGSINLWGDEIYFSIPVEAGLEDARETVSLGDIAYWPPGKAICIFLGKTPISKGEEIRPASAVNLIGRIEEAKPLLGKFQQGDEITIRRS